jgi:acyl-CoA reductase-like NAD-dependent aldehyde dehydrogenase
VVTVESLDEAIEFVNAREKPLTMYVFTESRKTFERINKLTSAGGVCHNDTIMQAGGELGERERSYSGKFSWGPIFADQYFRGLIFADACDHAHYTLYNRTYFGSSSLFLSIHAVPSLPFGGVGNSGFGCYHFKYTFDTFSHYKGVLSTATGLESLNK